MKRISVSLAVILLLLAEQPSIAAPGASFHGDIQYGMADSQPLLLDASVPKGDGRFPVAIVVHGGGWGRGNKAEDVAPILDPLTKANFTWFSINYRLAPTNRWPACFEDVQTAIRWVKAHAAEFKGDPGRIALIGYSAGGHLACYAAVMAKEDTRVRAVVGFAAPIDLMRDTERRGGLSTSLKALLNREKTDDEVRGILEDLSPISHLHAGLPPFLLVHGTEDKSVPFVQSINLRNKLHDLGVPCDLIALTNAPHAIMQWTNFDTSFGAGMTDWLDRALNRADGAASSGTELKPDIVVAANGSGDFRTVQAAVDSIPRTNQNRMLILVKDGVYHEKVRVDASCVTLRGQSRSGTRIEFPQLNDDFTKQPDDIGRAVVNVNGNDCVLENITVANTAGVIGPHSFAVYGRGDRTVILDSDILSEGADTLSLWLGQSGRYYHANCNIRGAVDFVCPRGWCYVTNCSFYETKKTAAMWHDGHLNKDMKFVLNHCRFDGVDGWNLARHHMDAQFYFLDCTFAKSMTDRAPFRVIYPLDGGAPSTNDIQRNAQLDASNIWGERAYYFNCHRDGGDYAWFKDNLTSAPNAPPPSQINATWTFAGKWDPESTAGPRVESVARSGGNFEVAFSENVTVKGSVRLVLKSGAFAPYVGGGGGTLIFKVENADSSAPVKMDLANGAIFASEASAHLRFADAAIPAISQ